MDRITSRHAAPLATATGRGPAPREDVGSERGALVRRERDFGVGYGSSSGYASQRRSYVAQPAAYFRFR